MLQDLRAGDITVFIDMTHDEHSDAVRFAQLHHAHSAIFYLRNTSWRGLIVIIVKGLYRIDYQDIRLHLVHSLQNIRKSCFRKDEQFVRIHTESLGPQLQLALTFFTRYIQYFPSGAQTITYLKEQCGFTDARRSSN